jgi:YegS/Rv2252/BmrU family lipid kinase
VVAAGGDGTIHDVANGILSANAGAVTTLGLLPIGRGNDFVKVVPGTRTRDAAFDTLATGAPVPVDAGVVEWEGGSEYFLNAMGTGIDVEVVRQIARTRKLPAGLVYIVGLAKAFVRFEALPLRITADARSFERRVMIVAVANGTCVGGSFRVSPDARPDDGRLDVCVVDEVNLAGVLRIVPRIMRGTHAGMTGVHMMTARAVTIDATGDAPLFFQLDGELREPAGVRSVRIAVVPAALRVLATARRGAGARTGPAGAAHRERT